MNSRVRALNSPELIFDPDTNNDRPAYMDSSDKVKEREEEFLKMTRSPYDYYKRPRHNNDLNDTTPVQVKYFLLLLYTLLNYNP